MSRKLFSPRSQQASKQVQDEISGEVSEVRVKKVRKSNAPDVKESEKGSSGPGYSFTGVTPGKIYMHPPSRLINGRIIYHCMYLGHLRVSEPRGAKIVHDAVDKLKAVAAVNRANYEDELKEVDLSVSIRSLVTVDRKYKKAIHQHPLPLVSFSADDKRGAGNIFAYISRGKPPTTEHVCYVYKCTPAQAQEITTTVGQAFELAYMKFLETKQAQEDFKRLKALLRTATPEKKVAIEQKLIEVNKIRAAEAERQKKMAAIQAKMPEPYTKPVTKIKIKGTSGAGLYTGSGKDSSAMFDVGESREQQESVKQIEIQSEHQMQTKTTQPKQMKRADSSVASKWENITVALEPFQMEPTMNPSTQYRVRRVETEELDLAIMDIERQIQDLEEAFDWRHRKGQGPAPSLYDYEEEEEETNSVPAKSTAEIMAEVDEEVEAAQIYADEMEMPVLPANYVMEEFVKAREKAALPKKGTVKDAAGVWYQAHHD